MERIILKNTSENHITLDVGGKLLEIQNKLNSLQAFLENRKQIPFKAPIKFITLRAFPMLTLILLYSKSTITKNCRKTFQRIELQITTGG